MQKGQTEMGRVVVAGATGYLGSHVARALHADGWTVRALARDESRLEACADACDEVFVGQATVPSSLPDLFAGADAAFSSIGIRHFKRRPTYLDVDLQANLNLIDLAEKAGVKHFVFVSVLSGEQLRARSPLIDARETVVDRLRDSPMRATILRPTGFFNDLAEVFEMARGGRAWLIGDGTTRINPIHGTDLAAVAAEALRADEGPMDLNVGGPDIFTQREIAELAFDILNRQAKISRVPASALRVFASFATPFNKNLGALLKMFSMLGDVDAVGTPVGTHHLRDHFQSLALEGTAGS